MDSREIKVLLALIIFYSCSRKQKHTRRIFFKNLPLPILSPLFFFLLLHTRQHPVSSPFFLNIIVSLSPFFPSLLLFNLNTMPNYFDLLLLKSVRTWRGFPANSCQNLSRCAFAFSQRRFSPTWFWDFFLLLMLNRKMQTGVAALPIGFVGMIAPPFSHHFCFIWENFTDF